MDKATQKSIEWQKANHPMAIGGDAFADMVDSFNVNPAFVAGYKEAEKDLALTAEDVRKLIEIWMNLPDFPVRSLSQIAEETLDIFNEQRKK